MKNNLINKSFKNKNNNYIINVEFNFHILLL